jgi:hypothetical protein
MRALDEISREELKDYLAKGWLTHDGMWFYSVYKEFGADVANRLNKEAIRQNSYIEIGRARRVFGVENKKIDSFGELTEFLQKALELTLPQSIFSKGHFSVVSKNVVHWEWENKACFAFKGMERLGIVHKYKCGVIYRIECWFDALGIKYTANPKIDNCLMAEKGYCSGDFIFYFNT